MSTLEDVRLREKAAARCTAKIKRKVLRKQARKARAEHLAKCSLELVKRKDNKKTPLTELYVKRNFTEHREEWQKEIQRHCEEVYTDLEETNEVRETEMNTSKRKVISNSQWTDAMQKSQLTWCCKPRPN